MILISAVDIKELFHNFALDIATFYHSINSFRQWVILSTYFHSCTKKMRHEEHKVQ